MPFDPALPANGSPLVSAEMRGQLNALKDLIDAIATLTAAQIDGVTTVDPTESAGVSVSVSANTLHFTFAIPRGPEGTPGTNGIDGLPGEVSQAVLDAAIAGTSGNSNGVGLLNLFVSDPPTQGELQAVANKVDELITALRRP